MRLLVLLVSLFVSLVSSGRILFVPSTLYPSHGFTLAVLADELAKRGHHVTWLEIGPQQPKTALLKNITREYWPAQFGDSHLSEIFTHRNHSLHDKLWDADFMWSTEQTTGWLAATRLCDAVLSRSSTKAKFDKIVQQQFDTIVVDDLYNPCGLLLVALKKSVYVYWSQTAMRTECAWANQSPSPPSYLPVPGTGLTDDLTFDERVYNVASYFKQLYLHQHVIQNRINAVFQKHFPGVASVFDIERNASINFVNTPPVFDFARPYMPRVNFVGGLNCRKAHSLPQDIAKFVNEGEGFVVLSTGFTAQWKRAPKAIKTAYTNAMKSLPNIRFVWQFDSDDVVLPANVFARSWLPLQDLLGHPRCLAHVTHGGLNSVIESVWHGVPIVGIPLTARGLDNILRLTARDSGILLEKKDLNAESLRNAINEVVTNKRYKEEVTVFQDMVTDVPFSELYHAVFWIEFIERHQEVPHARSGADQLNVFQYFLVDVICFFISVAVIAFHTIYFIVRTFLQTLRYLFCLIFGFGKLPKPIVTKAKKKN